MLHSDPAPPIPLHLHITAPTAVDSSVTTGVTIFIVAAGVIASVLLPLLGDPDQDRRVAPKDGTMHHERLQLEKCL